MRELEHEIDYYTPINIRKGDTKALRKEYTALRAIANKRLKRINESKINVTRYLANYPTQFNTLKALDKMNDDAFTRELIQVVRFLYKDKISLKSIKTLREQDLKGIATLHEHGYTFINASNYDKFVEYMELVRSRLGNVIAYKVQEIMEIFENAVSEGELIPDELEHHLNTYIEMEEKTQEEKKKALAKLSEKEKRILGLI